MSHLKMIVEFNLIFKDIRLEGSRFPSWCASTSLLL